MGLILVDTSIWIDHIRSPVALLTAHLAEQRVLQHPFVTGEVALGSMANRQRIMGMLSLLPQATAADGTAFLDFVEEHGIFATGLGFVDAHLLASAGMHGALVWSSDKRLAQQAARLGLAYE